MSRDRPEPFDDSFSPASAPAWTVPAQPATAIATAPDFQPRILFLDDDPRRAAIFLSTHPHAVWVQTVEECLKCLAQSWDEAHLDHDLGGKVEVAMDSRDCGMEVVRWLCGEFRSHLAETLFLVHTHNFVAGLLMVLQMRECGYRAEFRPFGDDLAKLLKHDDPDDGEDAYPAQAQPAPAAILADTPARPRKQGLAQRLAGLLARLWLRWTSQ